MYEGIANPDSSFNKVEKTVMENFETLEKYILGELSVEEMKSVEVRLEQDHDLRKEYSELKDLLVAIESKGLEESLRSRRIPEETISTGKEIHLYGNRKSKFRVFTIAAAIAALLIGGWWIYDLQSERYSPWTDAFYTDPGLPTKMSAASDHYSFYDGMIDYKMEDYSEALEKWSVITEGIGQDTIRYYQAMALLNLARYSDAMALLEEVPDSSDLYEEAEWRKLEIYIREENYEEAKVFLSELPPDIHPAYEEVAKYLKNK